MAALSPDDRLTTHTDPQRLARLEALLRAHDDRMEYHSMVLRDLVARAEHLQQTLDAIKDLLDQPNGR